MVAKVRIKAGPVEFEYEGETELKISDIKDLFTHIETLFTVPSLAVAPADNVNEDVGHSPGSSGADTAKKSKLHVNSIASKLSAKTGPEVAVAAAAFLQIMEGKESFSRSDLLKAMQAAKMYYRVSMGKNLTKHIASLIGKQFNQLSHDNYSLKQEAYSALESQLA